jgi:hypothetical protein
MGFDAVVIGSIASVVVAIIVVGVIAYRIMRQMGDDNEND